MSATLNGLTSLLLMMQAAPATAAKPGDVVPGPRWASRPTGEDLDRVYPPAALRENRSGAAAMKCAFAADGRLRNCRVLAEQPQGYGFGDAILRLAPTLRLDVNSSTHPVEGATIVQSFRFDAPGQNEAVRIKLQPGEVASLVTVLNGPARRGAVTVPCASPDAPARLCQFHPFDWVVMPTAARSGAQLAQSDQQDGLALMECRVTAQGGLTACKVGGASKRNEAALLELSKDFRAPQTAVDGATLVGGRVVLTFDWTLLASVKAPLPGEPAPPQGARPSQ